MQIFVENINKVKMESLKEFIEETFSPLFKGMKKKNIAKRNKQIFLLVREVKNLCSKDFHIFVQKDSIEIDFQSSWFYKTNYFYNSYEKVESSIIFYFKSNNNKMKLHTSAIKFREKVLENMELYMQNKKSSHGVVVFKVTKRALNGDKKATLWLKDRGYM